MSKKKVEKELEAEEYLNMKELYFLMENAENYYNDLKYLKKQLSDEALYIFITMLILKNYRKTDEIKITNMLLMSYEAVVKAMINHDEKFIIDLINFIENGEKEDE